MLFQQTQAAANGTGAAKFASNAQVDLLSTQREFVLLLVINVKPGAQVDCALLVSKDMI